MNKIERAREALRSMRYELIHACGHRAQFHAECWCDTVDASLDEAEALRAGLEDAVEALEEYYDSIKRHQSDRSRADFLLRLNHYRALLAQEDKDDDK